MSERCPHCSFNPTTSNDYCSKHKPKPFKTKEELWDEIQSLTTQLEAKQAKIDELMLEYCPDEMTEEQLDEWGKHQVVVKGSEPIQGGNDE